MMKFVRQAWFPLALALNQSVFAAPLLTPATPIINAKGYILVDFHSQRAIAQHNADTRMEPASLTKMMTAYVVSHELDARTIHSDDEVLISDKAWRMPGSRMFIKAGTRVTVDNLIKGVIIQSGNDAAVALAEHVAGSENAFADLMNEHAQRLGLISTHFANSTGLPHPNHYSTPRDLAALAKAIIQDHPGSYSLYAAKEFEYNNIKQKNRNDLLWEDDAVDGLKTGHTNAAGYCLVASARKNNMRLIAVVLGTRSENQRAAETKKLLDYGFRFFETKRLYEANEPITEVTIWKGAQKNLTLGLREDLYVTIPRGQFDNLKTQLQTKERILAPASNGQRLGTMTVKLGDQSFAERNLVALESVQSGTLLNNLMDDFRLLFDDTP